MQILAVGTISARKGYDLLLRACAQLRARGLDFRLKIVGQGPERLRLRWLAWRLGLRKVVDFAGQTPHENMADFYKKADIFVSPGRRTGQGDADGLPSALAEAMAFGLAVVVSDLPGLTEAVEDGKSGLVTPQNDAAALAQALERLAAQPGERARLGNAARTRIHALLDEQENESRLGALFSRAIRTA